MAILVGTVGALAYCSWPLGFLLDPALATRGLASDLEVHGQPYSWLFILLDCVTGAATLFVVILAWRRRSLQLKRSERTALCGYGLFGAFTAIDALVPVDCARSALSSCGADLGRPNLDDGLTGLAVLSLFVAMISALAATRTRHIGLLRGVATVDTLVWAACGVVFFVAHFSASPAVGLQHAMLSLTSVTVALVPALVVVGASDPLWTPRASERTMR